ncbi:MAG: hypothetical protein J6S14_10940 [Clostridia bacterium]|nr:hypothetical protein [Clostridia bacterium]
MRALDKKITKNRNDAITNNTLRLCIATGLLLLDDFSKTNEESKRFVEGFAEVINGYGEEGGLDALLQECTDRGIELRLGDDFYTTPGKKRFERGGGERITTKTKKGNKKTLCSRCKTRIAETSKYCRECGAVLRG